MTKQNLTEKEKNKSLIAGNHLLALFSEKIPKGQMLSSFLLNFPNEYYEIKLAVTETRQKKYEGST